MFGNVFKYPGSLFHRRGPMQLKDLAANVFNFVNGICSFICSLFDCKPALLTEANVTKFCRYVGPSPVMERNTRGSILNSILFRIGNQWSSFRHSVVLLNLAALFISFADIFCTLWSLSRSIFGKPV